MSPSKKKNRSVIYQIDLSVSRWDSNISPLGFLLGLDKFKFVKLEIYIYKKYIYIYDIEISRGLGFSWWSPFYFSQPVQKIHQPWGLSSSAKIFFGSWYILIIISERTIFTRLGCWLVVYLPLWKILVSWDDYSQYMKKNVPNHQSGWIVDQPNRTHRYCRVIERSFKKPKPCPSRPSNANEILCQFKPLLR